MQTTKLNALLETENQQLKKLNDLVIQSVEEERLLSSKLYEYDDPNPSFPNRLADKVATFGGSWSFILSFFIIIMLWIGLNAYQLTRPFDPYPFILLNLLLSTLAALQAPIIMMSQNRKEEKDRQRAINDYMVNLKAEIEIRNLHLKLDLLIKEQMNTLFEMQKVQMDVIDEINARLNDKGKRKSL